MTILSWKTWPLWAWAIAGLAAGAAIGALLGQPFNGACLGVVAGACIHAFIKGARRGA